MLFVLVSSIYRLIDACMMYISDN